jgi:arylsulfatase A-like enzyme
MQKYLKTSSKRILIALLCLTGLGLQAIAAARPNIVWIFSDDHSYQTIGAYGGRLESLDPSPNIDRIADGGMRFDRCYVGNSICAPARATLLTGKHSHLNGKLTNRGEFNHDQQQFQKILRKNGYQTVMVGKIHLNGKMQGFDYWDVLPGQGKYDDPVFINENGQTNEKGHVSDVITDKALDWLQNRRDESKPFMLMVHHKAPHRNWTPADRHMVKYADVHIPEPDTLFDDYSGRTPGAAGQTMEIDRHMTMGNDLKIGEGRFDPEQFAARNEWYAKNKPEGKDLVRYKYQLYMKDYLRCTWGVDESVGRILDYLEESGLDENTIVMYCSDQGFYMGEHGWFDKRWMYEESYRTPLVVKWPGVVKAGSVNTDLVQNIDFAETFLDLADAPIPDDMQGESLVPLFKGKTPKKWRTSLYYHYFEYPGAHSVRRHEGVSDKRYKLIRFYGPDVVDGEQWELYDLERDPAEMNSEYNNPEYASVQKRLKKELDRLRDYYEVPDVVEVPTTQQRNNRNQRNNNANRNNNRT